MAGEGEASGAGAVAGASVGLGGSESAALGASRRTGASRGGAGSDSEGSAGGSASTFSIGASSGRGASSADASVSGSGSGTAGGSTTGGSSGCSNSVGDSGDCCWQTIASGGSTATRIGCSSPTPGLPETIRTVVARHARSTCTHSDNTAHLRQGLTWFQRVRNSHTRVTVLAASRIQRTVHVIRAMPQAAKSAKPVDVRSPIVHRLATAAPLGDADAHGSGR